ncbi:Succinate-semialdehyde dehydrogenase [NADP(+)] [Planctomycetes bacterium MalM25]|nr:Succinate-semialdehyde dehydrogenase [NADP(+)] [Planctomycetes bacterium MalM25]
MPDRLTPMLINGERLTTGGTIPVVNPATGAAIGNVPEADTAAIKASLSAAEGGFRVWSATTPAERKRVILRYADLLEQNRERLVSLLIEETGKPRDNAEYDFGMLTGCLRFFLEEYERLDQPVLHDPDGRFLHYTQRQPLGVVVGLLAWNFPLLNLGYKLGPALAAGCSLVVKPSHLTPLASLEAAHLAAEAGVPDGVINLITSNDHEQIKPLLESPIPSMVTMIGSTRGGSEVMKSSCTSVKRFSVELGGNAPVVVYPDADLTNAANQVVDLKFANTGQVCVSPNRCFVHESVHEEFLEIAARRASEVKMGPLINDESRLRVLSLIDSAVALGAQVAAGGRAIDGPGYFMDPTILSGVSTSMQLACDEIFGPVLPVIRYTDADDPIALANDTEYGLAAYVFTSSLSRGLGAARDIQAGSVCINEPHYSVQLPHGGLKQSGVGKDCSRYSLEEYLTLKRVSVLIDSTESPNA